MTTTPKITRTEALKLIKSYAAAGDMRAATRLYLDHHIGRDAFNQAVRDGRAFARFIAERDAAKAASFVDVSTVTEYGLTQKLSNSVRVF